MLSRLPPKLFTTLTAQLSSYLLVFLSVVGTTHAEILVGLSQTDITPPPGGLTTGYSSAKPTDGVHDPVTARVVLLKSEQSYVALVSCDLCIFNSSWLHEQMPELGIDRLLLMNTHTHAGPKMSQDDFPSADKPWRQTVEERIVAAIKQAKSSLFAGYFAASESQIQLGYNRLVHRGDFSVTHFENPERIPYGSVDTQVGVIRITDGNSRVRAVLVNYACHPVVLGPRNIKISADYPGVMRDIVEEDLGDEVMCVFVQGAAGDINPLFLARGDDRGKDFEVVERMGSMLATEVLRAMTFIEEKPGASKDFLSMSSESSFRNRFNADEELTLGVSTLLINNEIGIITMPGEPFHKFQLDIRHKSNVPRTHFAIARSLMERGVGVLVEKPLVTRLDELQVLNTLDAAGGARCFVGQMRRFFPNVRLLKQTLAGGTFGRVRALKLSEGGPFLWQTKSGYLNDPMDGGVVTDTGAHVFDLAVDLGAPEMARLTVESCLVDRYPQTHNLYFSAHDMANDVRYEVKISRDLNEGTGGSLAHMEVESLESRWRPRILELRDEFEAAVRETIAEGVESKRMRAVDPKVAAFALLGSVNWTVKWFRPDGGRSARSIGEDFADQLVRGLVVPDLEFEPPAVEVPSFGTSGGRGR